MTMIPLALPLANVPPSSERPLVRGAPKVLLVEDDDSISDLLCSALQRRGFVANRCASAAEALSLLAETPADVIITDVNMAGMSGIELCRRLAETRADVPVIVITAFGSMEVAVEAMRAGAWDFVTKPFDVNAIVIVLERALKHRRLIVELGQLKEQPRPAQGAMIGQSAPIRRVQDLIERVSNTDSTVLIMGASGTGKELVARALHERSSRADKPFIAVNCAAMPETLLESELFGHVKGAFTDARVSKPGLFIDANGGTLFLDEIGELPLTMQPKLLRALQERVVRPVGGTVEVPFDVRVLTATNRDLEEEIEEKRFREDLFYRVNVVRIDVPPLHARGHDVLLLSQAFIARFSARGRRKVTGLSPAAADAILAYDWPGNVRELENCIESAVTMCRGEIIERDDLTQRVRDFKGSAAPGRPVEDSIELVSFDEIERRYVLRVLQAVGGNKSQAANVLGFDRRTLYRKLKGYGVAA